MKAETSENLYMRWEEDNDYGEMNKLGMFEEYLEMGKNVRGTPGIGGHVREISRIR